MNVFGVGPTELFVVLIVILVLFGPDRLPELAKKIGGASRELRDNLNSLNEQMNTALETSMELDKARMTPPAGDSETIAPASENSILPQAALAELPATTSEDSSTATPDPNPAQTTVPPAAQD